MNLQNVNCSHDWIYILNKVLPLNPAQSLLKSTPPALSASKIRGTGWAGGKEEVDNNAMLAKEMNITSPLFTSLSPIKKTRHELSKNIIIRCIAV